MTAARETHEILEFHGFPLFMFRLHQAQGEKKVGQKRDKIATKVGQNRDELYRFLCYTGFTTPGSPSSLIRLALCPHPYYLPHPPPLAAPSPPQGEGLGPGAPITFPFGEGGTAKP